MFDGTCRRGGGRQGPGVGAASSGRRVRRGQGRSDEEGEAEEDLNEQVVAVQRGRVGIVMPFITTRTDEIIAKHYQAD